MMLLYSNDLLADIFLKSACVLKLAANNNALVMEVANDIHCVFNNEITSQCSINSNSS